MQLIKALMGSAGLRILSMALSLILGIVLARTLGAEGLGIYSLIISITALLATPAAFGLPALATRSLSSLAHKKDWPAFKGYLYFSHGIVFGTSLLISVVLFAFIQTTHTWIESDAKDAFAFGAFLIPLVAFANLRGASLVGIKKIILGQSLELVLRPALFITTLLSLYFIYGELNATQAIQSLVVVLSLLFVLSSGLLIYFCPNIIWKTKARIESSNWLKTAAPMALTEGARVGQVHLTILFLGWFASNSDVGIYKVGSQLGELVALPLATVNVVLGPYISEHYTAKDNKSLRKVLKLGVLASAIFSLLILLGLAIFGESLALALFGKNFAASYTAFLIIGAAYCLASCFGPTAILLNMTAHEKTVTKSFLISLAVYFVLGLILIPNYGVIGAAITAGVGLLSWNFILWLRIRKYFNLDTSIITAVFGAKK